jgi:hypothetical protein
MTEIQEHPPSIQKMSTVGPLGSGAGDPRAPTINIKKRRWQAPWQAMSEIRGRPPSTQKNIDSGSPDPHGGSGLHPRSERCVVNLQGYDK